jgi:hypothetical protein
VQFAALHEVVGCDLARAHLGFYDREDGQPRAAGGQEEGAEPRGWASATELDRLGGPFHRHDQVYSVTGHKAHPHHTGESAGLGAWRVRGAYRPAVRPAWRRASRASGFRDTGASLR